MLLDSCLDFFHVLSLTVEYSKLLSLGALILNRIVELLYLLETNIAALLISFGYSLRALILGLVPYCDYFGCSVNFAVAGSVQSNVGNFIFSCEDFLDLFSRCRLKTTLLNRASLVDVLEQIHW